MKAVDGGEVKSKEIEDQGRDTKRLDYGSDPCEGILQLCIHGVVVGCDHRCRLSIMLTAVAIRYNSH